MERSCPSSGAKDRDAQIGRTALGGFLRVGAFLFEELECEVDALKFAQPTLILCKLTAGDEIGIDLVETFDHARVNLEHGAADAGVFVFAGCRVGAAAVPQLYFAFVEVLLEFSPLCGTWRSIFPCRAGGPALVEVFLVVPDDVFAEDGDVAVGCLDIEVSQKCGADVDGQAVIDQVRS